MIHTSTNMISTTLEIRIPVIIEHKAIKYGSFCGRYDIELFTKLFLLFVYFQFLYNPKSKICQNVKKAKKTFLRFNNAFTLLVKQIFVYVEKLIDIILEFFVNKSSRSDWE